MPWQQTNDEMGSWYWVDDAAPAAQPAYTAPADLYQSIFTGEGYDTVANPAADPRALQLDMAMRNIPQYGGAGQPGGVPQVMDILKSIDPNRDWSDAILNSYNQRVAGGNNGFGLSGEIDPYSVAAMIAGVEPVRSRYLNEWTAANNDWEGYRNYQADPGNLLDQTIGTIGPMVPFALVGGAAGGLGPFSGVGEAGSLVGGAGTDLLTGPSSEFLMPPASAPSTAGYTASPFTSASGVPATEYTLANIVEAAGGMGLPPITGALPPSGSGPAFDPSVTPTGTPPPYGAGIDPTAAGAVGAADIAAGAGAAAGAAGAAGGAGTSAANSLLQRILNGTANADDWMSILGKAAPGLISAFGSTQQADKLMEIANQSRADRAPFLAKSMEWLNNPAAYQSGPGKASLDATLNALSVNGNPFGNPTSLALAGDIANRNWQNAVTGFANVGLSGEDSRAQLQSNAVTSGNIWPALGDSVSSVMTEKQSLESLLKQLKGVGAQISLV